MSETNEVRISRDMVDCFSGTGFFKVKADAFGIDRLQMDFVSLDGNDKTKLSISIYINIYKAVTLANDILSGRIPKLVSASKEKAANEGKTYPAAVWEDFGGLGVASVKAKASKQPSLQKYSEKNQAVSRTIRLAPGAKAEYVFTATQCAGKEIKRGAITPVQNAERENVMVGFDADKLKEIAYAILTEWDAYIKTQYMRGAYKSTWDNGSNQQQRSNNAGYNTPPSQAKFDDKPL